MCAFMYILHYVLIVVHNVPNVVHNLPNVVHLVLCSTFLYTRHFVVLGYNLRLVVEN